MYNLLQIYICTLQYCIDQHVVMHSCVLVIDTANHSHNTHYNLQKKMTKKNDMNYKHSFFFYTLITKIQNNHTIINDYFR